MLSHYQYVHAAHPQATIEANYNYWVQWQLYLNIMQSTEFNTQPRFPVNFFNAGEDEASSCSSPCNEELSHNESDCSENSECSEYSEYSEDEEAIQSESPKSWADMAEDGDEMVFDENFQL